MMQAVILAAGRGTRLHPITATRTKAMCPIAGKPMVERVMDTLAANGIDKFVIVINPDDSEIIDYFENKSAIKAQIQFVEQTQQLGMGHALLQAAPMIQDDFFLSSCDNLVSEAAISRMLTMWVGFPPPLGILTLLRAGPDELTRMGVVKMEGDQVVKIVEKPTLQEAPSDIGCTPIYMFTPKLLEYLQNVKPSSRGEFELQSAIQELIDKDGNVLGMMLSDRIDLTRSADLLRLNLHYLKKNINQSEIHTKTIGVGTQFNPPVFIESGAMIGKDCTIGPNVFIENTAAIEDEVRLENCVVLRGSKIQARTQVNNQVIHHVDI